MKYLKTVLCAVLIVFASASLALAGTVETQTSIYGYDISKGYTIYAKSFTTSASEEVVGYSSVASAGYNATGKRVKVVGYELNANGTVNVKFQSGGADDIYGSTLWYMVANARTTQHISIINNQPIVLMQSAVGASLSVNLSAGQAVSGTIFYFID